MADGFGRDISCLDTLRTGRFSSGVRLVAEACYRRLITPRGELRGGDEDGNYGLDLTAFVGAPNPASVAASLPGRIRSELSKDERVETVNATVTTSTNGPATTFLVAIDVTTSAGPFTLTLEASDVTIELLGLEA